MRLRSTLILATIVLFLSGVESISAQRKPVGGKVCGDPTLTCKNAKDYFQSYDLQFDPGKNVVVSESELFYAVILKSAKMSEGGDCVKAATEDVRLETQELFPRNKVFATQCEGSEIGYPGIPYDIAFMGVYAGRTLAEANTFLKVVKATKKFDGAYVKRIRVGFNGT